MASSEARKSKSKRESRKKRVRWKTMTNHLLKEKNDETRNKRKETEGKSSSGREKGEKKNEVDRHRAAVKVKDM